MSKALSFGNQSVVRSSKKNSQNPWVVAFQRFRRNRMALIGLILLILIATLCIAAPLLTPYDPTQHDLYNVEAQPSYDHWLGTDGSGRDVFARLLYGGRVSLTVGVVTMLVTMTIGTLVGAVAGYYGGWIDNLLMRFTDVIINFPFYLLVITIVAIVQNVGLTLIIMVIALVSWTTTARLVRGQFLSSREQEYVLNARSIGCSDFRVIFKHILPNMAGTIIVQATILMGTMIIIESGLSFLGFGVAEPFASWGQMLSAAQSLVVLRQQPWLWVPPGAFILTTVLAINFVGDGLRDALDPGFQK